MTVYENSIDSTPVDANFVSGTEYIFNGAIPGVPYFVQVATFLNGPANFSLPERVQTGL